MYVLPSPSAEFVKPFTPAGVRYFEVDRSSTMATWTKHPASHRGESLRCGWYSAGALAHASRALALGGGLMPRFETKSQTSAFVRPDVANSIGVRAAGPPG
jgi:hypothetical protein